MKSPGPASATNSRCSPHRIRAATNHVDHALLFSMVMGTGFGVRVDRDGTRPQLVCAGRGMGNGRRTCHARRLGSIEIKFVTSNYPNTVKAPVRCRRCCHFATPLLTNPCYFDYCAIVTSVSKPQRA